MVTERIVVGKVLVFITGMLVITGLTIFLFVEPIEVAAWAADPDVLLAVVLANLAFLVIRLFSTGHAWLAGGGRRVFAVLVLAVIVAIPHAAIAWVGLETRDSLLKVFPEEEAPVVAAPTATTSPTTTTTLPTTTTTEFVITPVASAAPGEYANEVITRSDVPLWRPFGEERLNVLLLGGDAGPGRRGLRTDTMMVASIDPVSGDTALIGIPRNYGGVTFKDGTEVPVRLLNAVYGWGNRNPEGFDGPDAGAAATRDVIENITGLEIDHYMLVDLTGFAELVDAFGGVRLDVTRPIDGPLYDPEGGGYEMVRIEPGEQVLDGGHARAYARAWYGTSDYSRMGRQRCIVASMARDADMMGLVSRLADILTVIETNTSTDIPLETVPDLIRLSARVESEHIRVIGFDGKWRVGRTVEGAAVPDVKRIRDAVREVIENPGTSEDIGALTADAACG
jgi:LCP family protein required for cell wall assembly